MFLACSSILGKFEPRCYYKGVFIIFHNYRTRNLPVSSNDGSTGFSPGSEEIRTYSVREVHTDKIRLSG